MAQAPCANPRVSAAATLRQLPGSSHIALRCARDGGATTDPEGGPMQAHRRRKRLLVVSNETVEASVLHDTIVARADATDVTIVAPALNSRLRHWVSDEDPARRAAAERLERCTAALADAGVRVDGRAGAADPPPAIADALSEFPADELLIVTHPEERSNWLARDLVPRACARFSLPVLHLLVEGAGAQPALLVAA